MKIAVTYENGEVFQHFGHTEQFKIYTIENNKVVADKIVDANGSGHGALAGLLKNLEADALICGGIGGGAKQALSAAGITLYGGVSGKADAAVSALLAGSLNYSSEANCNHHHGDHHHHDHNHGSCGHGSCGTGHCGSH